MKFHPRWNYYGIGIAVGYWNAMVAPGDLVWWHGILNGLVTVLIVNALSWVLFGKDDGK